jgi:hypothetical protein
MAPGGDDIAGQWHIIIDLLWAMLIALLCGLPIEVFCTMLTTMKVNHASNGNVNRDSMKPVSATLSTMTNESDCGVPDGICSACGEPATNRCAGCLDAPSLADGNILINGAWYCHKKCQEQHWKSHQQTCLKLRQRRLLARSADFIKKVFLIFKRSTWDLDVTSVTRESNKILMLEGTRHVQMCTHFVQPFPKALEVGDEVVNAMLTFMKCSEGTVRLSPLFQGILEGTLACFRVSQCPLTNIFQGSLAEIEFLACQVHNPPLHSVVVGLDGRNRDNLLGHVVWKVTTKAGEVWAVDPTASQYGWHESLLPWSKWLLERGRDVEPSSLMVSIDEVRKAFMEAPGFDLFVLYKFCEVDDAASLLLDKLLPCAVRAESEKRVIETSLALRNMFREGSQDEHREQVQKIYDRLADALPFCLQHWLEKKGATRREEIRTEWLKAKGFDPSQSGWTEAEIEVDMLANKGVTPEDMTRALELRQHKAFPSPKQFSESSALFMEVFPI